MNTRNLERRRPRNCDFCAALLQILREHLADVAIPPHSCERLTFIRSGDNLNDSFLRNLDCDRSAAVAGHNRNGIGIQSITLPECQHLEEDCKKNKEESY